MTHSCDMDASYSSVFPFELSDWQKRALKAIEMGDHCLVTAPTGSGKTVPAEYAIHYFTERGKKIIYTSPIKALSNQKYYEFQKKFGDKGITFGILTGDIKDNPEADVLIMTTEILCNHLHNMKYPESKLDFTMDLENELGCVVFDEVHYINDADRGTVWEECFMLLPKHIQLVMLSATIATPEKFAGWIESLQGTSEAGTSEAMKKVVLCDTSLRAVPLSHYLWMTAIDSAFKSRDTSMVSMMERVCNKPILLYNERNGFQDKNYYDTSKVRYHLQTNHHIKRQHILNSVVGYMNKNDMLPAICFVYSRKNVERFAKEIQHHLSESIMVNKVEQECRNILSRFPNAKEYMGLDEYRTIISLVERGVGIHHSGLLPVFREMIELLFERGYIRMLFATETFAVGLNMPTKTVLFTALKKFDGSENRYLLSHEYTQQAGRAGRRGHDTLGNVIHLVNLFELPTMTDYKILLGNVPQRIVSKLKISYAMVLNCKNPIDFIKKSAIQHDIQKEMEYYSKEIHVKEEGIAKHESHMETTFRTPMDTLHTIIELEDTMSYYRNKQRKQKERELAGLIETNKFTNNEVHYLREVKEAKKELEQLKRQMANTENYVASQVAAIRDILHKNRFGSYVEESMHYVEDVSMSTRSTIARNIKETHPLMMTDLFEKFEECSPSDLVALFSCFTNVNVGDDMKRVQPSCDASPKAYSLIKYAQERLDHYYNEEIRTNIFSGADYHIHYDLSDDVLKWSQLTQETECEGFLVMLQRDKGIFIGEFVKAILKINAIAKEMEKICEIGGYTNIQYILAQIGDLTLKSVCTTQSLYV